LHTDRSTVALEDLLVHREWVRRLAMRLTRDEHEADDVEQQTWVAALDGWEVESGEYLEDQAEGFGVLLLAVDFCG
jgi:hypothetical protein